MKRMFLRTGASFAAAVAAFGLTTTAAHAVTVGDGIVRHTDSGGWVSRGEHQDAYNRFRLKDASVQYDYILKATPASGVSGPSFTLTSKGKYAGYSEGTFYKAAGTLPEDKLYKLRFYSSDRLGQVRLVKTEYFYA